MHSASLYNTASSTTGANPGLLEMGLKCINVYVGGGGGVALLILFHFS